jgi:hypothetical protein
MILLFLYLFNQKKSCIMKLLVSILFLSMVLCADATVHTVSNDPNKPAEFSSPTTALAAAQPGDTLYVYNSLSNYGNLLITKSITLIGAGFNTRKEMFSKTIFNNIDLATGTLNNVEINGIVCSNIEVNPSAVYNFSDFIIRNCVVLSSISSIGGNGPPCGSTLNNWLIENCYTVSFGFASNQSCVPASPAVTGFLIRKSTIVTMGYQKSDMIFLNCQIGANGSGCYFAYNQNDVFNNCIFLNSNFEQSGSNTGNVFNNCLTYQTTYPSPNYDLNTWTGGASGTATNCIINQNPLWVTPPQAIFYITAAGSPCVWDPVLMGGSPAHNAGSDGTDIGLTGSLSPYNFHAEPDIPVVRRFQLVNSVVPPNGTVTIKVTATKAE